MSLPPKWTPHGLVIRARAVFHGPDDVTWFVLIGAFLWRAPSRLRRHQVEEYLSRLRAAEPRLRGADLEARCDRIERLREAWLRRRFFRRRDHRYLRSLTLYRFLDPGDRPMALHFASEGRRSSRPQHVWVTVGDRTFDAPLSTDRLLELPARAMG